MALSAVVTCDVCEFPSQTPANQKCFVCQNDVCATHASPLKIQLYFGAYPTQNANSSVILCLKCRVKFEQLLSSNCIDKDNTPKWQELLSQYVFNYVKRELQIREFVPKKQPEAKL
jgi:hypothetical protein